MQETEQKGEMFGQEANLGYSGLEVIAAVLLGLATLGSAWSAYQSALWDGIQTFHIAESGLAGRRAAEKAVAATQLRMIDAVMLERYVSALNEKNKQLADFLFQRLRPEMKVATESWLATKPLENASAPLTPFVMQEYSLAVEKDAQQFREAEAQKFAEAKAADKIADSYLLLTVFFGMVLFLSGITSAFERQRMRALVLALSVVTMAAATVAIALLPLAVG